MGVHPVLCYQQLKLLEVLFIKAIAEQMLKKKSISKIILHGKVIKLCKSPFPCH